MLSRIPLGLIHNKGLVQSQTKRTVTLTGALKWGTVWTSTSTGTGIMKDQIWTYVFC